MPELPEVETIRRGLKDFIVNKKITKIEVLCDKSFQGQPENAENHVVKDIRRFGKALILDLDNDISLMIHLRMTGQLIYDGKEFYQSKRYDIDPIIDRVGGGDSFSGGLIHGLLTKPTQGEALEFAVAASALKHTIPGDFNLVSVEEVEALAGGNANGRVQR